MERIATGIPHLDDILHGGLPKNSTTFITGVPGSGKSILAHQIVFNNATPEHKALIITTISEPLARLIQFLQEFAFFDVDKIGQAVVYEDLGPQILDNQEEEAVAAIVELVRRERPAFLIIDSFKALHDISESPPRLRRALYRLAATLATLPCTTLLLGEYGVREFLNSPEASIPDGIIELRSKPMGLNDQRTLRVHKLRGSAYIPGEHSFRITEEGITVFSRLRPPRRDMMAPVRRERVPTGIHGLDEMLGGGLLQGTTTLLAGDPGVGKTITAWHFILNGARRGEPGVYISMQEDASQLRQLGHTFGYDVEALEAQGLVKVLYASPVELDADEHAQHMFEVIRTMNARRVVIDSIRGLEAGTGRPEEYFFNYVYSLTQWLRHYGVTAVLTSEMGRMFGNDLILTGRGLSHIADALIVIRYVPGQHRIRRALVVLTMRGGTHSTDVREYIIDSEQGPHLGGPLDGGPPCFPM